jgi:hypothetical protein
MVVVLLAIWLVGFVALGILVRLLVACGDWLWFEALKHDRNHTHVKLDYGDYFADRETVVTKKTTRPKTLRWVFGKES